MSDSKWDRVRGTFKRAHNDLFEPNYEATFFNYTAGTYDSGTQTGRERARIGVTNAEIVPPATDTTIDREGHDLSFSTSIRFPYPDTDGIFNEEIESLTVKAGTTYTVASDTTEYYTSVTVEEGATLTIDGELVTETTSIDGTATVNGTITDVDDIDVVGPDSLTVAAGETVVIDATTTEYYTGVTIEATGELIVYGTLITTRIVENGTLTVDGSVFITGRGFTNELTAPGDGVDKPTEVELYDEVANDVETYQVHAYSEERGSGMLMVRLEEL